MSLIYASGSIMETTADAIVNPVNCAGVMGKGLAKRMADRWPHAVAPYQGACRSRSLRPGGAFPIDLWSSLRAEIASQMKDLKARQSEIGSRFCYTHHPTLGEFFKQHGLVGPRWMLCVATKDHWRQPSRVEWVESGLLALSGLAIGRQWSSVAVPALGCGLGGLSWAVIRPRLEDWATAAPFEVRLYPPTE